MPNAGDTFEVEIKEAHLGWGTNPPRRTQTRPTRNNEAYIKIPKDIARRFDVHNSNDNEANTLYDVECVNGAQINGQLLAQGCSSAGDIYAKQFSVQGNLQELNRWYTSVNAEVGGRVRVSFTTPTSLSLEYIPPENH